MIFSDTNCPLCQKPLDKSVQQDSDQLEYSTYYCPTTELTRNLYNTDRDFLYHYKSCFYRGDKESVMITPAYLLVHRHARRETCIYANSTYYGVRKIACVPLLQADYSNAQQLRNKIQLLVTFS